MCAHTKPSADSLCLSHSPLGNVRSWMASLMYAFTKESDERLSSQILGQCAQIDGGKTFSEPLAIITGQPEGLENVSSLSELLLDASVHYLQTKICQDIPKYPNLCQNMRKILQNMPRYSKICQNTLKYAKRLDSVPCCLRLWWRKPRKSTCMHDAFNGTCHFPYLRLGKGGIESGGGRRTLARICWDKSPVALASPGCITVPHIHMRLSCASHVTCMCACACRYPSVFRMHVSPQVSRCDRSFLKSLTNLY